MRSCSIVGAILMAAIAIPALVISVLYNGVAQTIFVAPRVAESLTVATLQVQYQDIAPYILRNALNQPDGPNTLLTALFPDQTARATARQVLPQLLMQQPDDISMSAFAHLLDTELKPLITTILMRAPQCTSAEESALQQTIKASQIPRLSCNPTSTALMQDVVDTTTQLMRQALDAKVMMSHIFAYSDQELLRRIDELRAGAVQSIAFPATLIIIIVALAVRSRRQLFGWIGGVLIASATLGLPIVFGSNAIAARDIEQFFLHEFTPQANVFLPLVLLFKNTAMHDFVQWSITALLSILGVGVVMAIIALALPKHVVPRARTMQPLGPHVSVIGDGSTNRVKTDYETDALSSSFNSTAQLPPGLDTNKLTFGRRMPKIPQPTQPITDMIPVGEHTNPIPTANTTESLVSDTHTQELAPKEDSQSTQRTDEHRF